MTPLSDYMAMALEAARQAALCGEVPVGAVIVDTVTGQVVAMAGNKVEILNNPAAHAEMLVIQEACQLFKSPRLPHCDLYVTLEPCPMCAQAISFARIRRLYFGAYDIKGGGVEHGARIFDASSCHHRPEIYGGIQENAASVMLREFFKEKR